MKVLICDDQEERCRQTEDAIDAARPSGVDVTRLVAGELTDALKELFETVKSVFEGGGSAAPARSKFSDADLVIVDNNLAHLQIQGARLTAESIAGYLRIVSPAYVVSVNKNPEVDFDLRFLVGDYTTRADLALNTEHLGNLALWTGKRSDASGGFIPWYWPALLSAPERRRRQIASLRDRLKDRFVSTIELPGSAIESLSRHARGALDPQVLAESTASPEGRGVADVTLEDFLRASSRTLPLAEERKQLIVVGDKGVAATVLAADLEWWLRRDVMGPQEALVDVPHLLSRMPFLLGNRAGDLAQWSAATESQSPSKGFDEGFHQRFLAPEEFPGAAMWLGRPAFWWPRLRDNVELNKHFSEGAVGWPEAVFCEDVSDFVLRDDGASGPREFVAEFESPWDRRYVKQLPGTKYAPRSRLAA